MWKFVALTVLSLMFTSNAMDDMHDMDDDAPKCALQMRSFAYTMFPAPVRVYIKRKLTTEMKSCLDYEIPEISVEMMKDCAIQNGLPKIIEDMLETENLPTFQEFTEYQDKFYKCSFKIAYNGSDFNAENFLKAVNINSWKGNEDDKKTANEILKKCIENSYEGDTVNPSSVDKCFLLKSVEYCENEGRTTGLLFTLHAGLKTMGDDSKCESVEVDPKYKALSKQCMKDAVDNIGEVSDDIKNEKNKMEKAKKLMKRFMEKIMYRMFVCTGEKFELYNPTTRKFNIEPLVNSVSAFKGWDSGETRDKITNQMRKCGKLISKDYSKMNQTEMMKTLWMEKMAYEKCFWPHYVLTCGLKSQTPLTRAFAPLLDPECREDLHEAFMTTTASHMDVNLKSLIHEKMASLMTVLM